MLPDLLEPLELLVLPVSQVLLDRLVLLALLELLERPAIPDQQEVPVLLGLLVSLDLPAPLE